MNLRDNTGFFDIRRILLLDKRIKFETKIFWLFNIILIIFAIYLLVKCSVYHYNVIRADVQLEFREGAQLVFTQNLLDGKNIYDLENQPQAYYVYGPLYNLIIYPFSKIFGSTFLLHRIISGFFIVLSIVLLFYLCRKLDFNIGFSIVASSILYQQLLYRTTPLARPDSLGFFLFLSSFAVFVLNINLKSKLIFSSLLIILAVFTKQYFVIAMIIISASIMLFSIRALILFISIFIIGLASPLVLSLYFTDIFIQSFIINSLNSFHPDNMHLIKQIKIYIFNYYSILFGYIGLVLFLYRYSSKYRFKDILNRIIHSSDSSEIKSDKIIFSIFSSGLIISSFFLIFKLGKHVGATMIYFYQLLTIFLIILLGYLLRTKYIRLIFIIVLLFNIIHISKNQKTRIEISSGWVTLEKEICSHDRVLNNPAVVGLMIKCGKKVWDSGQTIYFTKSVNKYTPGVNLSIKNRYAEFKNEIIKMTENKKFDLILTIRDKSGVRFWNQSYLPFSIVKQNYFLFDTIKVRLLFQKYNIELWKRK